MVKNAIMDKFKVAEKGSGMSSTALKTEVGNKRMTRKNRVDMACTCELFIKGNMGFAITPYEIREILFKADYECDVKNYHEIIDLSFLIKT